ncbi:hypothetical protein [Mesorhizobium sp. M2D.F.Ca.ET.223.01.1.1]|uniref:hypothetical protein n=1 Tax=Mesorhizobium sp. M2D.F.Ca.ET.223.01.1.1 TaxID=2563940 RepID=UPI00142E9763|nr:hypothetical protein [Mesorhizobium sp. M2D.F.Ca.ET.223.01.1.1]
MLLAKLALDTQKVVFVDRIGLDLQPGVGVAASIDAVLALLHHAFEAGLID